MVEMTNLTSQTSYELTSTIISSANIAYKLGSKTFTTLKRDFVPENITDIKIDQHHALNETHVDVVFKWEPARDETCFYEILIHYEDAEIITEFVRYPELFYHQQTLPYDVKVSVAVRGLNSLSKRRESKLHWIELFTDECKMNGNNKTVCGPENVENFSEVITHIRDNVFDISLKWSEPTHHPDFYSLLIRDVDPRMNADGTPDFFRDQINGVI